MLSPGLLITTWISKQREESRELKVIMFLTVYRTSYSMVLFGKTQIPIIMSQRKCVLPYFIERSMRFGNRFFSSLFFLFTLIGCSENTASRKQETADLTDSAVKIIISKDTTKSIDTIAPSLDFKKEKNFEILSIKYELSSDSIDNVFYKKCKGWSLSADQIKRIIPLLEPIDVHDFNYLYSVTPCQMAGKIKVGGREFDYLINAGSYMKIYNRDTTYILACRNKKYSKFFLTDEDVP